MCFFLELSSRYSTKTSSNSPSPSTLEASLNLYPLFLALKNTRAQSLYSEFSACVLKDTLYFLYCSGFSSSVSGSLKNRSLKYITCRRNCTAWLGMKFSNWDMIFVLNYFRIFFTHFPLAPYSKQLNVIVSVYVCSCREWLHVFSFTYLASQHSCFCTTVQQE